jgi:ATP-dependent Clp protease ATP-binding subunit ClpA
MLRETPYAVLLLDEFEKAGADVRNLFLQILDEGRFSDAAGKSVNARNTIIVATSNAGADYIWEKMSTGEGSTSIKEALIDRIVKAGIYTPELLNRFDAVVVFHPLLGQNLEAVARLMLEKLGRRLEKRGIKLRVTPELAHFVAQNGADPKFGARPMNRFIQDRVEAAIADAIIRDNLGAGSVVEITGFANDELTVSHL